MRKLFSGGGIPTNNSVRTDTTISIYVQVYAPAQIVAARDTLNNVGDTAFTFIYRPLNDPAVSLTVDSLADSSVVKSLFPLHARSAGNAISVYYASAYNERLLDSARDSIPAVDLSV